MPDAPTRRRRWLIVMIAAVYGALLAASMMAQSVRPEATVTRPSAMVPEFEGAELAPGARRVRVTYLEWAAAGAGWGEMRSGSVGSDPAALALGAVGAGSDHGGRDDRPAVLLLHGSPGDADNFASGATMMTRDPGHRGLGERLAARGYRVIAPDLPGFGQSEKWVRDYSIRAHAAYCLALLDTLGIERAHVVGWSMGGGVALEMADQAPGRVASLTLMASIGTQESEGSGSYAFEHFKYALGYAALVVGVDLLPHFGMLPERWFRHASMRNFLDTDMRPLRRILRESRVPMLVLHGRHDVLAGVRGAEEAARLHRGSRLVITSANHFLPIAQAQEMEERLAWFLARHDARGAPPLSGVADLSPAKRRSGADAFVRWLGGLSLRVPWWLTAMVVAVLALFQPRATAGLSTLAASTMTLDFGVAAVGVLAGWAWKERRERGAWGVARLLLWVPMSMLVLLVLGTQGVMPMLERVSGWGAAASWLSWVVLGAAIVGGAWLVAIVPQVWTWRGRRKALASVQRMLHHEWWSAKVFYLPVWPWLAWLTLRDGRRGGPLVFTCANPGIPGGGGIIGESKSQILECIGEGGRGFVLSARLIEAGGSARERADRVLGLVEESGRGSGDFAFPVILKPDMAFRGYAMKLARSEADVRAYFQAVTGPVIVQKYHPGPEECGLFWVRTPAELLRGGEAPLRRGDGTPRAGRIFAVTRKRFPVVTGDGRRTLERLILDHPRLRCQWRVFFTRHAARLGEVLPEGEALRLAQAGNHAQGTLFTDGSDLVTPALEDVVDRICDSYRGPNGLGYDFGRMDVRYESDDLLRQGQSLGIVEMNGSTSEATNLYDPSFSAVRSYTILFRQWSILYRLGGWRRGQGVRPIAPGEIVRHWREYHRQRSGSAVAD